MTPLHHDTARLLVHAHDPQEQASSFGMLEQSYEQLSPGRFSGSLFAVSADDITVFQETLDQSVFQTGISDPDHFTIAAACELSERARTGTGATSTRMRSWPSLPGASSSCGHPFMPSA